MKSVRMLQAFRWFCPECETENFDRAKEVEFESEEERRSALIEMQIDPDSKGSLVTTPSTVVCRSCLEIFSTIDSDCDCEHCDCADDLDIEFDSDMDVEDCSDEDYGV